MAGGDERMTRVIKHGDGIVEYEWDGSETDWEKEAIREYGVTQASEISDALAWKEAMDELESDTPKLARVMRGKHPTEDKEIGQPNKRRGPPTGDK